MFSLVKRHLTTFHSFSKKRKRLDAADVNSEIRMKMQFGALLESAQRSAHQRMHGADKGTEKPRVRKNLEKDIFEPLGEQYLRRAYRMKKESFYKLYSILKSELEDEFLPFMNSMTTNPSETKLVVAYGLKVQTKLVFPRTQEVLLTTFCCLTTLSCWFCSPY